MPGFFVEKKIPRKFAWLLMIIKMISPYNERMD